MQFNAGGDLILEDVGGFDSPNIRQNLADLPEADGAIAGDFFLSSRPVTMSGRIVSSSAAQRNSVVAQMQRAVRALRADLTISTQPQGMPAMQATARLDNLRIGPGYVKTFQLSLVCPDPRFYSQTLNSQAATSSVSTAGAAFPWSFPVGFGGGTGGTANLSASNAGNIDTYPLIRVYGPVSNPQIENHTTGQWLYVDNVTLAAGEYIDIDVKERTVVSNAGANLFSHVRFPDSSWWTLPPGGSTIQLWASSSSTGVELDVSWRDAWA